MKDERFDGMLGAGAAPYGRIKLRDTANEACFAHEVLLTQREVCLAARFHIIPVFHNSSIP